MNSIMSLTFSIPSTSGIHSQYIGSLSDGPGSLPGSHPTLAKGETHYVERQGSLLLCRLLLLFSSIHLTSKLVILPCTSWVMSNTWQIWRASIEWFRNIFNSGWKFGWNADVNTIFFGGFYQKEINEYIDQNFLGNIFQNLNIPAPGH